MIVSTYRVFTRIFLSYYMWQSHLQNWKRSGERNAEAHRLLYMWGDEFFTILDLLGITEHKDQVAFETILKSLFRHYNVYGLAMHYLEDILSMEECEKIVDFCLRKESD